MSRFLVGTVAAFVVVVLGGCGEPAPTGAELGNAFCGWLERCHPVPGFDLDACRAPYENVTLTSTAGVAECIDALESGICPLDEGLPPACRSL